MTTSAANGREVWVSPSGSDTDPGTKKKPFAALPHARSATWQMPDPTFEDAKRMDFRLKKDSQLDQGEY